MPGAPRPPRGLLRLVARTPIWLYRLHLGWLLGDRFLMLEHTGRRSGRKRRVVLEVVKHDSDSDSYFVVSAWGVKADWLQNLRSTPQAVLRVGRRVLEVRGEEIGIDEAAGVVEEYSWRYPLAFRELTRLFLGEALPPGWRSSRRLAERMPMVVLRPC
jgi:deazaflavin-dependent oxidoreductase (nitroreductase family)